MTAKQQNNVLQCGLDRQTEADESSPRLGNSGCVLYIGL